MEEESQRLLYEDYEEDPNCAREEGGTFRQLNGSRRRKNKRLLCLSFYKLIWTYFSPAWLHLSEKVTCVKEGFLKYWQVKLSCWQIWEKSREGASWWSKDQYTEREGGSGCVNIWTLLVRFTMHLHFLKRTIKPQLQVDVMTDAQILIWLIVKHNAVLVTVKGPVCRISDAPST